MDELRAAGPDHEEEGAPAILWKYLGDSLGH